MGAFQTPCTPTFRPAPGHGSVTGWGGDESSEVPGHASAGGSEVDQLCPCVQSSLWAGLGAAEQGARVGMRSWMSLAPRSAGCPERSHIQTRVHTHVCVCVCSGFTANRSHSREVEKARAEMGSDPRRRFG